MRMKRRQDDLKFETPRDEAEETLNLPKRQMMTVGQYVNAD